jgi:hypothetical protein
MEARQQHGRGGRSWRLHSLVAAVRRWSTSMKATPTTRGKGRRHEERLNLEKEGLAAGAHHGREYWWR